MFGLKYQSSKLFNLITAIILSVLCLLLAELTKIDFHKMELPKDKPVFSATGISANLYESNGHLLYDVYAESGVQFPDSSVIELREITVKSYVESTGELSQQLTSNDGWIDTKTSKAFLGESVVITVMSKDPKQIIHAYTRDVNIDALTKKVVTVAPIRATQGQSVLTGIGVSLDYDKQFLTIESNVKVIYVPTTN